MTILASGFVAHGQSQYWDNTNAWVGMGYATTLTTASTTYNANVTVTAHSAHSPTNLNLDTQDYNVTNPSWLGVNPDTTLDAYRITGHSGSGTLDLTYSLQLDKDAGSDVYFGISDLDFGTATISFYNNGVLLPTTGLSSIIIDTDLSNAGGVDESVGAYSYNSATGVLTGNAQTLSLSTIFLASSAPWDRIDVRYQVEPSDTVAFSLGSVERVPEPSSALLAGIASIGFILRRRKK